MQQCIDILRCLTSSTGDHGGDNAEPGVHHQTENQRPRLRRCGEEGQAKGQSVRVQEEDSAGPREEQDQPGGSLRTGVPQKAG